MRPTAGGFVFQGRYVGWVFTVLEGKDKIPLPFKSLYASGLPARQLYCILL